MIAVIFEVTPKEGMMGPYLDMAARMKEHLEGFDGFISVERFESLTTPGKLLSLSFWEDEEAVQRWRKLTAHRGAQEMGRQRFFEGYRLRVSHVLRDYGMEARDEAPLDSRTHHGAM